MDIRYVTDRADALALRDAGFEPIECTFGEPIVGPLQMDHHGPLAHLEGVAIRAYRDHLGVRANDPRFVVTGTADADATFAIAALAGLLPRTHVFPLLELAEIINTDDVDPNSINLAGNPIGHRLLFWQRLMNPVNDALAFYGGVDRWRTIITGGYLNTFFQCAQMGEEYWRLVVEKVPMEKLAPDVGLVTLKSGKFGPLYKRSAVLVGYIEADRKVRIGVRNKKIAEALFGPGGLLNVFPHLRPTYPGNPWSGREDIGGSPRGVELTIEDARAAAAIVVSMLKTT